MAEVAIPLIALGSLYISSNKSVKRTSKQKVKIIKNLFHRDLLVIMYNNKKENFDNYVNPNDQRTKFYDKNAVVEIGKAEQNKPQNNEFISLTGKQYLQQILSTIICNHFLDRK